MLKIQFKDRRKPAMWLVDSTIVIGSDSSCDIVINEEQVAPRHAELIVQQNEILLKNVSGNRSVFINEFPILKEQTLVAWDVLRLGTSELEIIDPLKQRTAMPGKARKQQATVIRPAVSPWMLKATSAPLEGQYFSLASGFVVGRDEQCDVVVPLSYVSRQHAKFTIKNEKLSIEDLGSSNGTYVNNDMVKSAELRNGDEIRFDEFIFKVIGPENKEQAPPRTIVRANATKVKDNIKAKAAATQPAKIKASHKVFMHGMSPDVEGKVFEITNAKNHISRMLGHHLSTSEQSVSARHVYLHETDVGWEIKNNGAADGLLVNGKMQARAVLEDGDELNVGGTLLKFQSVGEQPLNYAKPKIQSSALGKVIVGLVIIVGVVLGLYFSGLIK